ncbi:hypothetical protein [Bosea sp. PAMC 26642]|uniref:hypothetical protein n=1 Tax=Bosea sp. (strain PAMC 26642) TaxID=1792307 RepID=UPI000AA540D7|nr:hypothetical protein [Bosea sp. PAMC 26642]
MPFRNLVAEPDVLAKLSAAFDVAWTAIGPSIDPLDRSAEREYLGSIIFGLWECGETEALAAQAVIKFQESPRLFSSDVRPDARDPESAPSPTDAMILK